MPIADIRGKSASAKQKDRLAAVSPNPITCLDQAAIVAVFFRLLDGFCLLFAPTPGTDACTATKDASHQPHSSRKRRCVWLRCANDTGAPITSAAEFGNIYREENIMVYVILIRVLAGGTEQASKIQDMEVKRLAIAWSAVPLGAVLKLPNGAFANGPLPLTREVGVWANRSRLNTATSDQAESEGEMRAGIENKIRRHIHFNISGSAAKVRYRHLSKGPSAKRVRQGQVERAEALGRS